MENTIDKLLKEVGQLSEDQRLALANRLLSVGDFTGQAEVTSVWDSEICARIAGYDRGELCSRSLKINKGQTTFLLR